MLILMPRKYFLELFFIFELKKLSYVSVPIFLNSDQNPTFIINQI